MRVSCRTRPAQKNPFESITHNVLQSTFGPVLLSGAGFPRVAQDIFGILRSAATFKRLGFVRSRPQIVASQFRLTPIVATSFPQEHRSRFLCVVLNRTITARFLPKLAVHSLRKFPFSQISKYNSLSIVDDLNDLSLMQFRNFGELQRLPRPERLT